MHNRSYAHDEPDETESQVLRRLRDADAAWLDELSALAVRHEPPAPAPHDRVRPPSE